MACAARPSAACNARRQAADNNKLQQVGAHEFAVAQHAKACNAPALHHNASSRIAAVHVDGALAEVAALAAVWAETAASRPATLIGAWAARQQAAAPAPALSADAEDVAPRLPAAPTTPYIPPARREGATAAILAGAAQPAPCPAPYVPPHSRTAEQQAAAAEAGRPGCICAFPCLTAGPLPQPSAELEALLPLYRLALLFPSQRC